MQSAWKKLALSIGIVMLIASFVSGCTEVLESELDSNDSTDGISTKTSEHFYLADKVSEESLPLLDDRMSALLMEIGYTLEQAGEIQVILNKIGIESIEIQNVVGAPPEGLHAVICYPNGYTNKNRTFYFSTEDGVLFYAGFKGEDLYDTERGGFLMSYADVHVPETRVDSETHDKLMLLAESAVKGHLSNPGDARFHLFSWTVARSDDKY